MNIRNLVQDGISSSSTIQGLDTLRVTVSKDGIVLEGVQIITHLLKLNSGKKQINIDSFVNKLDAWYESFPNLNEIGDSFSRLKDTWKHSKEMLVSIDMPWCYDKSINISSRGVNTQSVRPKLKNLSSRIINCVLILALNYTTLLYPVFDNGSKLSSNHHTSSIGVQFIIFIVFHENIFDDHTLVFVPFCNFIVKYWLNFSLFWLLWHLL